MLKKLLEKVTQNEEKLDWIINHTCQCNPVGSESQTCNVFTNQCQCRPGFEGRRCQYCQEGFYGNPSVQCLACNCDPNGLRSTHCNSQTGQCEYSDLDLVDWDEMKSILEKLRAKVPKNRHL